MILWRRRHAANCRSQCEWGFKGAIDYLCHKNLEYDLRLGRLK